MRDGPLRRDSVVTVAVIFGAALFLSVCAAARGRDVGSGRTSPGSPWRIPATTGRWEVMSDGILAELGATRPKPSDPFATMTAGIAADRTNGDVFMLANNVGICKSTDQGKTFSLVSGDAVTGRFETGWGLNVDPAGGRLMCFTIYGSSAYSGDAGKTWVRSTTGHLDYGAVDWGDTGKAFLALGHESGGKLLFSEDCGAHWRTLGNGYWGTGLFDRRTLLTTPAGAAGILRSTDAGATWAKVSEETPTAPVPVVLKGVGYWLCDRGLAVSRDKGASWTVVGALPKGASLGPMIGRDARHMAVGASDGLYESSDGGKSWALAAPLAPEIPVQPGGRWGTYAWDPVHNVFYASQMMKPAYRFLAVQAGRAR